MAFAQTLYTFNQKPSQKSRPRPQPASLTSTGATVVTCNISHTRNNRAAAPADAVVIAKQEMFADHPTRNYQQHRADRHLCVRQRGADQRTAKLVVSI